MAAFYFRGDTLWVRGTLGGKTHKKSTGRKKTDLGFNTWYKSQSAEHILFEIMGGIQSSKDKVRAMSLKQFGFKVLNDTSEDRGIEAQKDVIRIFENQILTGFEKLNIEDISALHIAKFLKKKRKEYSADRAKRIKRVLNLILESAADPSVAGVIEYNPMNSPMVSKIKFGAKTSKQKEYTTKEIKLLLGGARGWMKPFLEIAFKHGLRVGEVMALKWNDFDLENGTLDLCRSISKGVITEITEETKDSTNNKLKDHYRKIILFPKVVEILKAYKAFSESEEWLFLNKDGKYFKNAKSVVDNHFKPLCKRVGVEYKTLRAARRAYASVFNYSIANKLDLQKNLGHVGGSRVTEKHYIKEAVLEQIQLQELAAKNEKLFESMLE